MSFPEISIQNMSHLGLRSSFFERLFGRKCPPWEPRSPAIVPLLRHVGMMGGVHQIAAT